MIEQSDSPAIRMSEFDLQNKKRNASNVHRKKKRLLHGKCARTTFYSRVEKGRKTNT